ncbi:ArsR/SmtB family transcription factor [Paeniglutamicibacter sp. NPDC012692]|uniref:ArsR/SmtB family transcription factor n=1 Tax=Paeniglutamicibacter sp. NPDC012692 TaxID=3364388 RepID=UPI0036964A49
MTMIVRDSHTGHEAVETHAAAAALFHGLADPTRLMILAHLRTGEHKVKDLTEHLGLAQSTVSAHLSCLRDCGLVTSRAVGRSSMFSLANPGLLGALLGEAQSYIGRSAASGLDAHDFTEVHGQQRSEGGGIQ